MWLLKNGCPWNEDTFYVATKDGSLGIMMWLLKNRCPWNENTFSAAAEHGSLENMMWLVDNGCPVPREICAAEYMGDNPIVQCMRNNGYRVSISFIKV